MRQAYRAARTLRFGRSQDLEDGSPIKVYICIESLSSVVALRIDNKSIVCMDVPVKINISTYSNPGRWQKTTSYLALSAAW